MTAVRSICYAFAASLMATTAFAEPYLIVGEMAAGNTHSLAIEDQTTNKATWVSIGDTTDDWLLRSYDPSTKTAVLIKGSKSIRIEWRETPQPDSKDEKVKIAKRIILEKFKKDFETREVMFIGDVRTIDGRVTFEVVKVLKSKNGRPAPGEIIDGGHWSFPITGETTRSVISLTKFPRENNSTEEWLGLGKSPFWGELTESDLEGVTVDN